MFKLTEEDLQYWAEWVLEPSLQLHCAEGEVKVKLEFKYQDFFSVDISRTNEDGSRAIFCNMFTFKQLLRFTNYVCSGFDESHIDPRCPKEFDKDLNQIIKDCKQ